MIYSNLPASVVLSDIHNASNTLYVENLKLHRHKQQFPSFKQLAWYFVHVATPQSVYEEYSGFSNTSLELNLYTRATVSSDFVLGVIIV